MVGLLNMIIVVPWTCQGDRWTEVARSLRRGLVAEWQVAPTGAWFAVR